MVEQIQRMQSNNGNIVMNVATKEESVEDLIKKLSEKGTKVKILSDDDANQTTPKERGSVKKINQKSPNNDKNEANKENKPAAVEDTAEKKRLEELKKQNEEI